MIPRWSAFLISVLLATPSWAQSPDEPSPTSPGTGEPEAPAPAPEAPTPEAPDPEAPAPEAPAPEAPAPEAPAPEAPSVGGEESPPAEPPPAAEPPAAASPGAPAAATGRIVAVEVRGNNRIDASVVLQNVRMRSGEDLTPAKVRRDLKAIWRTGFFDDVVVEVEPSGGGVRVVFVVDEKPSVVEVLVEGEKKVEEEDILEIVDVKAFDVLNQTALARNVDRIRDLYVEKGFYLVDVEAQIVDVGADQVNVVFRISEGRKVVVQRVEFSGNETVPDSKIKRFLQTKEGGIVPWLTSSGTFRQEALAQDVETIRYIFLEEGFVDVKVEEPKVYLSPDKRYIFVHFAIDEGEQYLIDEIQVTGTFVPEEGLTEEIVRQVVAGREVADVEEEQWRAATGRRPLARLGGRFRGPSLKPGDPFKLSTLQQVVGSITDLFADKGYVFTNVAPLPYTDPETKTVDLRFQIDRGEKYRIGRINITGNDPTLDKVVRREILVDEGDVYHATRIRASRARLQRLGYFDEVDVSNPRGEAPNTVDLNIRVSEQPTGSFSFGLGYSNLEKLVVTGSVSKNNFLGLGYTFSGMVNWSPLRKQYNVSIYDPYFLDSRWTFKVDGYNITRQFQLNEFQRGGSLEVGRYLDRLDDVRLTFGYTIEDVGLTSLDPFKLRMLGGDLYRNGLTSSISSTIDIDKRNNRINPTKGFYASAALELAGGFRIGDEKVLSLLGGEFNFVEARANFRFFQPLIPDKPDLLVFRMNSTMGSIWSTDGRVIPFIHRFRAGGINSVRGFQWFSLGPTIRVPDTDDPTAPDESLVVGGNGSWINNFEITMPIVKSAGFTGVVFFDAGNAFGDPWGGDFDPLDLRLSYGAGVRWQSPIGPLRFEWGFPVAPREGEKKSVFDFSIGSFF